MNPKPFGRALTSCALLLAACGSSLFAAPVPFEGTDPGAGPTSLRPNSNAAAASFDLAANAVGVPHLINFESAPLGSFTSLVIAPGVSVTLEGTDLSLNSGGIRNDTGSATLGYNTTTSGTKYLGFWPNANTPVARAIFNFDQPIAAFGSYLTGLGTAAGNLFVLFNDGSSQSIAVVGTSTGGAKFFGFTDAGAAIAQVTLELRNIVNSRDIFAIDDLRYSTVPEPTIFALAVCFCMCIFSNFRQRT